MKKVICTSTNPLRFRDLNPYGDEPLIENFCRGIVRPEGTEYDTACEAYYWSKENWDNAEKSLKQYELSSKKRVFVAVDVNDKPPKELEVVFVFMQRENHYGDSRGKQIESVPMSAYYTKDGWCYEYGELLHEPDEVTHWLEEKQVQPLSEEQIEKLAEKLIPYRAADNPDKQSIIDVQVWNERQRWIDGYKYRASSSLTHWLEEKQVQPLSDSEIEKLAEEKFPTRISYKYQQRQEDFIEGLKAASSPQVGFSESDMIGFAEFISDKRFFRMPEVDKWERRFSGLPSEYKTTNELLANYIDSLQPEYQAGKTYEIDESKLREVKP